MAVIEYDVAKDINRLLEIYRKMFLIRRFEEEAAKAYTEMKIGGFLHLYIGQEAVGLGVISALEKKDYVVTGYRDHGHYLARGGSAKAGMAELFGKATGCSKGRGGSMHFFDASNNFLGGYGIVGAQVPLAAGVAFASKYREEGSVAVCFLGDGAVSIGPFHEGMCLAALWKLPVVFVVENNQYSMGTPLHRTLATHNAAVRAAGYPMESAVITSNDYVECYNAARSAINRAREYSLPTLLEYKTYRYRGHSMADPGKYRTKEEVERHKSRDPIVLMQQRIERDFSERASELEHLRKQVEEEVAEAVKFAHESPEPDLSTVEDYTYI